MHDRGNYSGTHMTLAELLPTKKRLITCEVVFQLTKERRCRDYVYHYGPIGEASFGASRRAPNQWGLAPGLKPAKAAAMSGRKAFVGGVTPPVTLIYALIDFLPFAYASDV